MQKRGVHNWDSDEPTALLSSYRWQGLTSGHSHQDLVFLPVMASLLLGEWSYKGLRTTVLRAPPLLPSC